MRRLVRQPIVGRIQTDVALGRIERVQAAGVRQPRARHATASADVRWLLRRTTAVAEAATVFATRRLVVHLHFGQLDCVAHRVHRLRSHDAARRRTAVLLSGQQGGAGSEASPIVDGHLGGGRRQ